MTDLSQQPIIFTGKLNSLTRLQAQQLAAMLGALILKKMDYFYSVRKMKV